MARPFDLAPGTPYIAANAFQAVPAPWREFAGSPERLLAIVHQNEVEPFGAFQMVGHEGIGSDIEVFTVRLFASDGNLMDSSIMMQRTQNGWKRVHWPVTLEAIAKQLREVPPPK